MADNSHKLLKKKKVDLHNGKLLLLSCELLPCLLSQKLMTVDINRHPSHESHTISCLTKGRFTLVVVGN